MSLLTTKLYVPPLRVGLVQRPRLVDRLEEGLRQGRRLTLVSAPAGSGKTTLVSEWWRDRGAPGAERDLAWLSLDEGDSDPVRFLAYLVAALQQVDAELGRSTLALLGASPNTPPEPLLSGLLNDVAALPRLLVLVLDDYHTVQGPQVHLYLRALVEHQPPTLHLVVVTREDPPLPLARLRARGQMTDIRERDLRFSHEETEAFLQQTMALELSPAQVSTLRGRTEGWIAGLQLAALSMQQSDDVGRLVAGLDGSHRYILDYLVEEVLQQQSPDVQSFLFQTSILDRLSAGLCDAVTGRSDGAQMLHALDKAHLFLVPLDESRLWYRYHRLFRELLRIRAGALDVPALHRRAAQWLEQNGLLGEAMEHALAAQDRDEVARMIEPAAAEAVNQGQFATVIRWLAALPDAQLRAAVSVAALKAWSMLWQGQPDAAAEWAEVADSLVGPATPPLAQALVLCVRTYLAQTRMEMPRVVVLAHRMLELLQKADPHGLRGAALTNLASAQAAMGDFAAATETCRELARIGREGGHVISAVTALGRLAWFARLSGRLREGTALAEQALGLCVDARGEPLPLAGQIRVVLGMFVYEMDDLPRARELLTSGLETARQLGFSTGALEATFTLARIQELQGDRETALATIREARQTVSQLQLASASGYLDALEADWQLRHGDVEAAARWAEAAGLSPADAPSVVREVEYLAFARLLLAQQCAGEALQLLDGLQAYARKGGLVRCLIAVSLLQASAHQTLGRRAEALARVEDAVRLAAPEGYRRVLLDEGAPVLALLASARSAAPAFVDQLLGHGVAHAPAARSAGALRPEGPVLVEPLSEREEEVLRLVAEGLSNREIAERLVVSIGTVKTHVHHICGKLDATSRGQAVARARDLGLV